jgi:hypothetical protein
MRHNNTALAAAPRRGYATQGRSSSYQPSYQPNYGSGYGMYDGLHSIIPAGLDKMLDPEKLKEFAKQNDIDPTTPEGRERAMQLAKNTATGTGEQAKIAIKYQSKEKQMEEATKRGAFALGGAVVLGTAAFFLTPKLPGQGLITAGAAVAGFVGTAVAFNIADPIDYGKLLSGDAPQTTASTGTAAPEAKK